MHTRLILRGGLGGGAAMPGGEVDKSHRRAEYGGLLCLLGGPRLQHRNQPADAVCCRDLHQYYGLAQLRQVQAWSLPG